MDTISQGRIKPAGGRFPVPVYPYSNWDINGLSGSAAYKAFAELRRQLPPGGRIKEDYTFKWATDDKLNRDVTVSELFGNKDTLLINTE